MSYALCFAILSRDMRGVVIVQASRSSICMVTILLFMSDICRVGRMRLLM